MSQGEQLIIIIYSIQTITLIVTALFVIKYTNETKKSNKLISETSETDTILKIHQTIFKTVSYKAKDCNMLWINEQTPGTAHTGMVSELIISTEIIDKTLCLFEKNSKLVGDYKDDYYYLFWKQLRTDIRGWIRDKSKDKAIEKNNEYYTEQITSIHNKFEKLFEPKK